MTELELLQKNSEQIADLQKKVNRIHHYMIWQSVWSVLKFLIIVIPLVWGFMFALPYMKQALDFYMNVMNDFNSIAGTKVQTVNPADMFKSFLK